MENWSKSENWSKIQLVHINQEDFWYLYDEICDEQSDVLYQRKMMLEAYKSSNLFGLRVGETFTNKASASKTDELFCRNSWRLLPCFCVRERNKAHYIWTHPRARNRGFARELIQLLGIEYVCNPVLSSIGFWEKMNIKMTF